MDSNNLRQLLSDNRDVQGRCFEVRAAKGDEAEILLYDAIGGFFGIDASKFTKDLKAITAPTIHLRINSPGGDVFAARAIATAIREHKSKVVAHVDGLAASAASFVMLAADEIHASEGSFVMVHNPWMVTIGDAGAHAEAAELLGKIGGTMAADYARRSGKTQEEAQAWMDAETWFTAAEAKDAGLVDSVVEVVEAKASAHWNLSAYRNAPAALMAGGVEQPIAAIATAEQPPAEDVQGSAPDKPKGELPMVENPTQNPGQTEAPNLEAVRAEERKRISEIHRIGAAARVAESEITAAVDGGMTVQAFREKAFDAMLAAGGPEIRSAHTATVTADAADKRRGAMASAVLNRVDPKHQVDGQNEFRQMSCIRLAEESLVRAGVSVRGLSPSEIAIKAMHTAADFPYVLENVARKILQTSYEYAQPTYKTWTKPSTMPDFKTMSRPRLGETPGFLKVPEGAQITIGTMTESRETYALATYGRGVAFTRQALINDDLGAFNDLVRAFGVQASILENKTVYSILNTNGNMSDSVALFYSTHGNLGTGVIGNTGLDACFTAMATQKGVDGASVLNITPKFLIVPAAKAATANAAMAAVGPNVKASDQNWFAGRLQVVSDAELDGTSTAVWYAAADPGMYPGIEYAHLEGANGPQILRKENEDAVLGVQLYAFLDFAAKAIDWRPLYKSSGV